MFNSRALLLTTVLLGLPACPDFGEEPECRFNSDCDDDEECDDGECVRDDNGDEGEGEEGEGEEGEGEGEGEEGEGEEGEGEEGEGEEGEGEEGEGEGGGLEICGNFIDDDFNGFTDCEDFDCDLVCFEDCADGFDNDGDGRTDCADGGCASEPACEAGLVQIQDVQSGAVLETAVVTLDHVFLTVVHVNANGNMSLAVQEPQGEGNGFPYPEFAGVAVFIPAFAAPSFPDLGSAEPGDCVTLTGATQEFNGDTEITNISAFTFAAGCGTPPSPTIVSVDAVASDIDPFTVGNQPSSTAENFEGTLITLAFLTAATSSDTFGFTVNQFGGDPVLKISDFFLTSPPIVTAGDSFSSITGVFHTFSNNFELQPRDGDIVP